MAIEVNLVMFKSDGSRRDFSVDRGRLVVGRKNTCDLRIPLSSVSRQHCEVLIEDDGTVKLRDLGSSNGTFHNDVRVQEASLEAGDRVTVGPVVFTVVVDGEPSDIEPTRTLVSREGQGPDESLVEGSSLLPIHDQSDEPPVVSPESTTPTVDLDDPIAALEALADAEDLQGQPPAAGSESSMPDLDDDGDDDSGTFELLDEEPDVELIEDDDDRRS